MHFVDVTYHIIYVYNFITVCTYTVQKCTEYVYIYTIYIYIYIFFFFIHIHIYIYIRKLSAEVGSTFSRMSSLTTQVGCKLSSSLLHVEFPAVNAWFYFTILIRHGSLIMQQILLSEVPVCFRFIWFRLATECPLFCKEDWTSLVQRQEMVLEFYRFLVSWQEIFISCLAAKKMVLPSTSYCRRSTQVISWL